MGPTQADLDQIARERDSLQDQIRARDAEILSAQRTLGLLQSDLVDLIGFRYHPAAGRTITENQAQIRTLSRDLGKVVRERDALRHEYTSAFQRLTSISATIGAPPPQTQLRLDPESDTDQPAGGIPRSPSAETSGSEDQDADASGSKRSRSRSGSPSPSRPQKKRSVPLEADDESMDEEDESEFGLGGGSTGGRSPSPDQASTPPSTDEENAEVADDLYEAQTMMAISQSRSEARRRDHASPQRRSASGSGGSPGGSGGSDSDAGSGDQDDRSGPTGGSGPANPPPGRQPPRITFVPQVPFPEGRCVPGRRIARAMAAVDIDPWIESQLTLITMTMNFLFPILPFRSEWIFPHRPTIYTSPTAPAFCGHLITEANVTALQAAEPWRVIQNTQPPISFEADVGSRLGTFLRQYRDFEASELIAYWESTHKFPITAAMIAQSPWLGSFAKQRNNRRSHAGNRWKLMLLTLIQAMIEGWCDLDLLLDPFFLHFPKRTDEVAWYPGIEARRANLADPQLNRREPTDLLEALAEADAADPWRNHYRDRTADHPALHLPRLDLTFFGL
ncbi:Hypothetical protein PHPALM_37981 [Phytophthora palmivora]|uniref:Uncharacterized protein n=1 Tax=Phytophthora palmivora TaxID=4796 RepID=A0A2P4WW26_9STRA|nr:Hypothetical protein PHPALM_37981 [Phytophthora palmivora]